MLTATPEEPQKARFTKDNVIIKDRHYYNGNEISWNRPAQITDKYYPYFHQQKDAHKNKIDDLKNQETLDKEVLQQIRREKILDKKQETKARYDQRVLERTLIQGKSQQPLKSVPDLEGIDPEEEALDVIAKRIDASKHLRSNEISWNHLHKADQKYVDQYVRPICLQRENEMIDHFKKQIEIERQIEENKLAKRSQNHRAIREIFLNKHEENYEKEKKAGTVPVVSSLTSLPSYNRTRARENIPSIQVLDEEEFEEPENSRATTGPSLITTDGEFKLKYPSSLSNVGEISVRGMNSLNKLYSPQSERKIEPSTEYSELKGMLIKNMDYQVFHKDNALYQTLANNNKVFKDTLIENRNSRKKISSQNKDTSKIDSLSEFASLRDSEPKNKNNKKPALSTREEVFDELDKFDKKPKNIKGFNRTELEKVLIREQAQNKKQ